MKKCHQCAERVRNEAKACRFCGHTFPDRPKPPDLAAGQSLATVGYAANILLMFCLVVAQACSRDEATPPRQPDAFDVQVGAEEQLKRSLRDPESAQFRGRFVSQLAGGGMALCGEVNAKNELGGYAGYRRFIAGPTPAQPSFIEGEATGMGSEIDRTLFPELWREFCSNPIQTFD